MIIGHPCAILLHMTVFPTGVATAKSTSRVLMKSLDSFRNMLDTKEWVAPEWIQLLCDTKKNCIFAMIISTAGMQIANI
jgi:hypothetical protein